MCGTQDPRSDCLNKIYSFQQAVRKSQTKHPLGTDKSFSTAIDTPSESKTTTANNTHNSGEMFYEVQELFLFHISKDSIAVHFISGLLLNLCLNVLPIDFKNV